MLRAWPGVLPGDLARLLHHDPVWSLTFLRPEVVRIGAGAVKPDPSRCNLGP